MSVSDTVADMITIIRNASARGQAATKVKRSQLNIAILTVLKKERFIFDYKIIEDSNQGEIRVYLRAPEKLDGKRLRKIVNIQRVSRPGLRVYAGAKEVPNVLRGLGVSVLSTSKGIMTGKEARRINTGGEILLKVW